MLEGVLERLIISLCGDYLADFNREQLKVSVWNGDVTLKALKLRSSALDSLNLPLHVVSGHIDTLSIKVPWARLTSQPVQIKVDGIYVLAQPLSAEQAAAQSLAAAQSESKTADNDDNDAALSLSERSAYAVKRRFLDEHRERMKTAKLDATSGQSASSYSERTVAKIIANLHVHVSNVHIRYEDSQSIPRQTFAVGLTIAAIKIFTIDAQGRPTFVVEESSDDKAKKAVKVNMLSNKKVELTCGAFYWQCGADVWAKSADYQNKMSLIERSSDHAQNTKKAPLYPYILHPLDIGVKVIIHDDLNITVHEQQKRLNVAKPSEREHEQRKLDDLLSTARYDLSFTVNQLSLSVDQRQYTNAMQIADAFTAVRVQMELAALRARLPPPPSRLTAQWQRAYIRWAIQCVGDILHTDNNQRLRWSTIQRHGNDRRRYLQLYTRSLSSVLPSNSPLYSALSADEKTELKKLEIRLPLSSLIVYRTLCEAKFSAQTEWIESKKKADEEAERRKAKATAKPFWSRLTATAAVPVATIPAPHMSTASAAVAAPVAAAAHGTAATAAPASASAIHDGTEGLLAAAVAAGDGGQIKSAEERKRREEEQKRMLDSITLSDEQQKLITEIDKALPPNFKTFRVEIELTEAVFLLTRPQADTNDSAMAATPILRMNWDGRCVLEQFTTSSLADISVHSIECIDCVTPNTHFPLIVSSQSLLLSPTGSKPSLLTVHYQNELRSLIPSSPFDIAMHMSLSPLSITLSPLFVSALIAYFHTPQDSSGYVSAVASAQMQSTTDTLLSALTDHRAYDIILTVKQPRIIVPEDSQRSDSRMMIAEWNDMSLTTRPDTAKSATDNTIDASMYDMFELSIRSMKLLICSSPKQWEIIRMTDAYTTSPHLLYIIGGGYDNPFISDVATDSSSPSSSPSSPSLSLSTSSHRQHQGFDVELVLYTCTRNVQTLSNVTSFPPLLLLDGRLPNLHFTLCGETYDTFMSVQSQLMRVLAPIIDDGGAVSVTASADVNSAVAVDSEMSMMKSARKLQLADEQLDTTQPPPSSQVASEQRNEVSNVHLHATRKLLSSHLVIHRVQVDVSTARSFPLTNDSPLTVTKPPPTQLFTVTFKDLSLTIDQTQRDQSYLFLLESFQLIDHFQPHSTHSPFAYLIACQSLPVFPRYDLRWQEAHHNLSKEEMDEAIKQSEAADTELCSTSSSASTPADTTSTQLTRTTSSKAERHLISFRYRLILKPTLFDESELVMSTIRHPRTNDLLPILNLVDLQANTLHIQWNPSTIAAILTYITETQANITPPVQPTTNGVRRQSQASVTPTAVSVVSGTDLPNLTALNAQLNAFTMTLNKEFEGRALCRLEVVHLKAKHVHAIHPPLTVTSPSLSTFTSVGSLDNLRVIDLSTPNTRHQEIFGMKVQNDATESADRTRSVVSFALDTFLPNAAPIEDGRLLGSRMKVSISSIRIVAIQQVILELTDYLTEGIINVLLPSNPPQTPMTSLSAATAPTPAAQDKDLTNQTAALNGHSAVDDQAVTTTPDSSNTSSAAAAGASFSAIELKLFDPLIVVPRHETSTECLTANLGQIKVTNALVSDRTQYAVVCTGMELSSHTERAVSSLLKMDVAVTAMTALPDGAVRPRDYSDLVIAVDVEALNGTLTDDALLLILEVQAENLSAPPILTIAHPPANTALSTLPPVSRPLSPVSTSRNSNAVVFHYNDDQAPMTMDVKLQVKQAKLIFAYSQTKAEESELPAANGAASASSGLARMTLNGIALSMNRYSNGNTQSEVSLQSLTLTDLRRESIHSPFKKMLCPFSELHTVQAAALSSPSASPSSASAVSPTTSSAEFEVTWQDTADGRRDVVITVRRPCGFLIIPFWMQFADFMLSALNTATANAATRLDDWKAAAAGIHSHRAGLDHSDALARHLRILAEQHDRKAAYNSLPSEDKVALPFRSITIAASSCRLLLLEDASNPKCRALVMSCDVAIHLSQTEPDDRPYRGGETESFLYASEDRDLQVNRLRVFVCRADQPVVSAAHSIISPFNIRLVTESKTHKRYVKTNEETVFAVTAPSPVQEHTATSTSSDCPSTMTMEMEEHSDHILVIDVASGNVLEMRAAYQDIKLVMSILSRMQLEQATGATANTQNIAIPNSVTATAPTTAAATSVSSSSESGFIPLRHSVSQATASARVEWCELTVVLINDCNSRYVPLLLLRLMPATANALIKTKTESDTDMILAGTTSSKTPTLVVSPPHSSQSVYTVSVSTLFEVTSFNDRVIAWEPLIEPTHLSVQLHTETDANNENSTSSASARPKTPSHANAPAATVNISARSAINLNLTYATMKNMIDTVNSWSLDAANAANTAESFAPFIISNQTGAAIWYSITSLVEPSKTTNSANATANTGTTMLAAPNDFDVVAVSSTTSSLHKVDSNHRLRSNNETSVRRSSYKRNGDDAAGMLDETEQSEYHVSSGSETQLTIAQLQSAQHRHQRSRGLKTSLDDVFATILAARDPFALALRAEGDWTCPERIMIGRVGMRTYKLTRQRTVADKLVIDRQLLVVDVCQRDGCKFINMRSSTQIINRTHRPLLFCLHPAFDTLEKVKANDDKQFALIGPVKPGGSASVPFHLSHYEFISARPLSNDTNWQMFPTPTATAKDEKESEWQWTDGALDYEAVLKSVHASLMTTSASGSLFGHGFCMMLSSYAATQTSSISSAPQRFMLHVTANNQRSDHLTSQRLSSQGEALLTLSLTFAVPATFSNHLAVPAAIDIAYATESKHSVIDTRTLQPTQSTHFISLALSREPYFILKVDGFLDSLPIAMTFEDATASGTGEVSLIRNVRIEDRRQSSLIVHVSIKRIGPSGGGVFVQLYTTYVLVDRTGLDLVYGAGFQHDSGALSVHRVLPAYGRRIYAEVYENQRSNLMSWRAPFLPTDRPAWSNASGNMALAKETFQLPAHDDKRRWMWTSDWRVDDGCNTATEVDRFGWQYAFDFPAEWHGHSSVGYNVRRRRWIRTYTATRTAPTSLVCCYTSQRRNDQVEEIRAKLSVSDGANEWRRVIDAVGAPYIRRRRSDSRWSDSFDPTAHSDGLITLVEIETVEVVSDAEMRHAINRWKESQPAYSTETPQPNSVVPAQLLSLSSTAALPASIVLPPTLITNAHSFTRHNRYDIAVQFSLLEDPLRHTRLISFSPRYIISNETDGALYIRQAHRNRAGIITVDAKSFAPMWWIDAGGGKDSGPAVAVASAYSPSMYVAVGESPSLVPPKSKDNADALVSIAFPPANDVTARHRWRWSGAFSLKQAGSLTIACHSNNDARTRNVAINIVVSAASIIVSINNEDLSNASYRIDNRTDCAVFVRQELKADHAADTLKTVQSLHQRLLTKQQTTTSSSFHSWIPILASSPTSFAWSEPTAEKPHRLSIVLAIPKNEKSSLSATSPPPFTYVPCSAVQLDDIGLIRVNRDYSVYAEVFVDGATKVLSLTRRSGTSISSRPRSTSQAADDNNKIVRVENAVERTSLLLIVAIPFLTVSLIDRHPLELALLTLQQIAVTYTASNIYEKCEVTIGDIQVDNQLPNAIYPVILYQSTHRHRGLGQQTGEHSIDTLMKQRPFIQLSAIKLTHYSSLVHFKYVGFIMQELIIQIEQSFVAALVPFIDVTQSTPQHRSLTAASERQNQTDVSRKCALIDRLLLIADDQEIRQQINCQNNVIQHYRPSSSLSPSMRRALSLFTLRMINRIKSEASAGGRIIYLEQLVLQSIRCQFSFNSLPASVTDQKLQMVIERASSSASSSSAAQSTSSNDPTALFSGEKATFDGEPLSAEALRYLELLSYSALVFANAEDVRLNMAGLSINHVFATEAQLISLLSQHYVNTLTAQFLQLIGRSHALGNPLGLVSNLGSGVFDLFNEPATAFIKGPAEFGKGLAAGVGSLVKHSVYGVASSAGSLTATVGNALAALSVDDDWMRARKKQRSRQPKHAVSGLVQGGVELSKGIFDGVVGLVRSPIEGAMDSGVSGLAMGVGRGLIGVVAKPVSGAFDMVASIADGVKNTTTMFDETRRRKRQQRIVYGPDRLIKPYASKEIAAQCFLTTTSALRIPGHQRETYIDHFAVETDDPRAFVVRHNTTTIRPTPQQTNNESPPNRRPIAYVLTDKSIICLSVRIADRSFALIWSHYLTSIKAIRAHSPEVNEITLVIDNDILALIRLPSHDVAEHMANTIRNMHNRIASQQQQPQATSPTQ